MITLEKLVELNDKLIGLPAGVLTFFVCIAFGYAVKASHRLSNDWLPSVVMLVGTGLFMLMAPTWNHEVPLRTWIARNFCVGFLTGFGAWIAHRYVIQRIEKKMGWLTGSSETEFITKRKDPPP